MILVDTSIWVDHLRQEDAVLADLLRRERVLCHPLVIGELAIGQLKDRRVVIEVLKELPGSISVGHDEVRQAIEHYALFGTGLSYVDACLLTSTRLTPHASLWTRDKRMQVAARAMSIAANPLN